MNAPKIKFSETLPSFLILVPMLGFVIYKLVFEFNELEKWRILCLSVGGTLIFSMLLTYLVFLVYFKRRQLNTRE